MEYFNTNQYECWICPPMPNPPKEQYNRIPILQYTLDGVFVAKHGSMRAASNATGLNHASIHHALSKTKHKSTGGYRWEFDND